MRWGVAVRKMRSPRYACAPRRATTCKILREGVVQFAVARLNLAAQVGRIEQGLVRQGVHARHEAVKVGLDDEVGSVLLKRLYGRGRAGQHARE